MKSTKPRLLRSLAVALLVGAIVLVAVSPALGLNSFMKTWADIYPDSHSGDADCALCHGTSNSNLNAYGKSFCDALGGSIPADVTPALLMIEDLDSDGNGDLNLKEITANAQPGWTTGAGNMIYVADVKTGCPPTGSSISAPSTVPLPLDPPVDGAPVAIPGGPYTGNVNVPVVFDGSESYDSDGGNLQSYAWDFGDGATGTGMTAEHTYTVAGTFTVSLTVTDNEGMTNTAMATATISGAAVLDLDLAGLSVTRSQRLGKPVAIKLHVNNPGPVLGQAIATVVGVQDGLAVYTWRLNVYDVPGGTTTAFTFPSYTPDARGVITWTATVADKDPDLDSITASTVVK